MTVTTGSSSLPKLLYVGKGIKRQETQECKPQNHSASERRGTLRFAGRRPTSVVGRGEFTNDRDNRVLEPPQACVGKGIERPEKETQSEQRPNHSLSSWYDGREAGLSKSAVNCS
jgi:L-fucose isomerase-like protein